jgi:antitoxin component YwqK of YwqJK toxin-antitoxin module
VDEWKLSVFVLASHDFGCYDSHNFDDSKYDRVLSSNFFNQINWNDYLIVGKLPDGHFIKNKFNSNICGYCIFMEGFVVNGLQEGLWTFYVDDWNYLQGHFMNGKKEGIWKGFNLNDKGDTIVFLEIDFKSDLKNGLEKHYFENGKLHKQIAYKNGLKHGAEITYFKSDTANVDYINNYEEYQSDTLNGFSFSCSYRNPFDTISIGAYKKGKRDGRFLINWFPNKYIIGLSRWKSNGSYIKYHPNGIIASEIEFRNNLPYTLVQTNDTNGNLIEAKTLKEGNGYLNCYYDDGEFLSQFEYKDQLVNGDFIRYSSDIKIIEKGLMICNYPKTIDFQHNIERFEDINLFAVWQT